MKHARGRTKALLIALGDIQDLAGRAKGGYLDDRSLDRYGSVITPLDKIIELCIKASSEYYPVEAKAK